MSIRARFYVSSITQTAYSATRAAEVKLTAVSRGDQNRQWAAATPSGTLTMQVNNPPAAEWFSDRLGQDVELSFEDAKVFAPADGHAFREADVPEGHYLSGMCGECGHRKAGHVT